MRSIESTRLDAAESQRLAARFALCWAEHQELLAKLAALEAGSEWALAQRLCRLRRRWFPDGSRRHRGFDLCLRGLRLWRREGFTALCRRGVGKLARRLGRTTATGPAPSQQETQGSKSLSILAGAGKPKGTGFRVAFLGSDAIHEAQSLRYRAHNVIEALALAGVEGAFFPLPQVPARLADILSHDLIVLVRLGHNAITAQVIEAARRLGLPTVYDIDDYLFDPWVLPYIEAFRGTFKPAVSLHALENFSSCLFACDYFTGSTAYLVERAAAFGKRGFLVGNGLNREQCRLADVLLKERAKRVGDGVTRIGYFSGTRTHQADFRLIYPALMAVLRENLHVRLVIVGTLDLGEFPGLAPFASQIDRLPLRPWTELPAAIAGVDINLIPLELTPFNEGKSNLKYFEAGSLKVPSIASPTRIHRESIRHGHNGLLADTPEQWYAGLHELVADAERRERMGELAFEHVMKHYSPPATAVQAMEVYRQILAVHPGRVAKASSSPSALAADLEERIRIAKQLVEGYKPLPHSSKVAASAGSASATIPASEPRGFGDNAGGQAYPMPRAG